MDTVYERRQHHLTIVGSHQWKSRNITHGLRMSDGLQISTSPPFVISCYRIAGSRLEPILLEMKENGFRKGMSKVARSVVWEDGLRREPS